MVADEHKIEEQKKKRWKNKVATFYYVRAFSHGKPSQTNHEGIIHNMKPIQQCELYMAL